MKVLAPESDVWVYTLFRGYIRSLCDDRRYILACRRESGGPAPRDFFCRKDGDIGFIPRHLQPLDPKGAPDPQAKRVTFLELINTGEE